MSPAIEMISGYNTPEMIGRHFSMFIYEEDLPYIAEQFHQVLEGNLQPDEYQLAHFDRRGWGAPANYVLVGSTILRVTASAAEPIPALSFWSLFVASTLLFVVVLWRNSFGHLVDVFQEQM